MKYDTPKSNFADFISFSFLNRSYTLESWTLCFPGTCSEWELQRWRILCTSAWGVCANCQCWNRPSKPNWKFQCLGWSTIKNLDTSLKVFLCGHVAILTFTFMFHMMSQPGSVHIIATEEEMEDPIIARLVDAIKNGPQPRPGILAGAVHDSEFWSKKIFVQACCQSCCFLFTWTSKESLLVSTLIILPQSWMESVSWLRKAGWVWWIDIKLYWGILKSKAVCISGSPCAGLAGKHPEFILRSEYNKITKINMDRAKANCRVRTKFEKLVKQTEPLIKHLTVCFLMSCWFNQLCVLSPTKNWKTPTVPDKLRLLWCVPLESSWKRMGSRMQRTSPRMEQRIQNPEDPMNGWDMDGWKKGLMGECQLNSCTI